MSRPHPLATIALLSCLATSAADAALLDVEIVDRTQGNLLKPYDQHAARYVAGVPGHRYAIRLNNRSAGRLLVVLSVDGINVVSGETAAPGQTGYVLDPYASTEITGWRKSLAETAAFYFAALPKSYAARTGRPDNVGVIGAAVFREQAAYSPELSAPAARRAESATADSARKRDSERLGTGHGEREYAPTRYTDFVRATSNPDEISEIRYDSYTNLVKAGVIRQPRLVHQEPQAFPGFVPDPGR